MLDANTTPKRKSPLVKRAIPKTYRRPRNRPSSSALLLTWANAEGIGVGMSEVGKIVALLKSDAIEKQIAAAIVLGELKAKGPGVVEGLGAVLGSGVSLLQMHALDALSRVGAKKALPQIFPLLSTGNDDVRRAATKAVASVGEARKR